MMKRRSIITLNKKKKITFIEFFSFLFLEKDFSSSNFFKYVFNIFSIKLWTITFELTDTNKDPYYLELYKINFQINRNTLNSI